MNSNKKDTSPERKRLLSPGSASELDEKDARLDHSCGQSVVLEEKYSMYTRLDCGLLWVAGFGLVTPFLIAYM